MYLTDLEVRRLCSLSTPSAVRVYLAAKKYFPMFVRPRKLVEFARVSPRRAQLELADLCKRNWLEKEVQGWGPTKVVRFVVPGQEAERSAPIVQRAIGSDHSEAVDERSAPIVQRAIGSDHSEAVDERSAPIVHSLEEDPDLCPSGSSKAPHRPSIRRGVQGRAAGRTEFEKSFVQKISAEWALEVGSCERILERLVEPPAQLSPADVAAYLADARAYLRDGERRPRGLAFAGLEAAKYPLGAACTEKRVSAWLEWRAEHARPKVASLLELACRGCQRVTSILRSEIPPKARSLKCKHCGERTPLFADTEDQAIGELVKRAALGTSR